MSALTPNACAKLTDPNELHVLFASPVVKIELLAPAPSDQLHGFAIEQTAVVTDGHSRADLALPVGLRIFGYGEHFNPTRRLQVNDTIKIERMARLPQNNNYVIFVHDVELMSDGDNVNLMVSEVGEADGLPQTLSACYARIAELEAKLKDAEDGLDKLQDGFNKLLEPRRGPDCPPVLLASVVAIVEKLSRCVDESMADQQ